MLYQSEKRQKKIKKIYENVISRKSVFFRRGLSINGKPTKIKIIKIKNNFNESVEGLNANSDDICLLIEHHSILNIKNIKNKLDILGTSYHANVLIKSSIIPNSNYIIDWTDLGVKNIWIFKNGWIERLGIKINSNVSTKSKI